MKPSTRIAIAAVAVPVALLVAGLVVLPRLSRWFGSARTGLAASETPHFTAYAASPADAADRGAFAEEFASEMVARWGPSRGFRLPDSRVRLYLFPDREALQKEGLLMLGTALEYNGGYFSREQGAIALVKGDDAGLRHEITHMLCHASWPDAELSPWFSEGLAQWHEAGVEGGWPGHLSGIVSGGPLPLAQILDADQAAFSSAGNGSYYFESLILVSWLSKRGGLEAYLLEERKPGSVDKSAFAKAVNLPEQELERSFTSYLISLGSD